MILPNDVAIRSFLQEDIEPWVRYWTEPSAESWRIRGVNKAKIKSSEEFYSSYQLQLAQGGDIPSLATIMFKGAAVGTHSLTDIVEGESAVFHAHIWRPEFRRRGIAVYSYIKAADFFLNKLNFKKIIYKTPVKNPAPNRVKEKIGIPCLGRTMFSNPILIEPVEANVYEVDADLLRHLLKSHGIEPGPGG